MIPKTTRVRNTVVGSLAPAGHPPARAYQLYLCVAHLITHSKNPLAKKAKG